VYISQISYVFSTNTNTNKCTLSKSTSERRQLNVDSLCGLTGPLIRSSDGQEDGLGQNDGHYWVDESMLDGYLACLIDKCRNSRQASFSLGSCSISHQQ
jgi:hypothetical protein